jgi:hypothetical protein
MVRSATHPSRPVRLEAAFAVLDTIRRDMAGFKNRRQEIAAAFAELNGVFKKFVWCDGSEVRAFVPRVRHADF